MYARVTQVEIDTLRISIPEATALFRETVLPGLRKLEGFAGVLVLVTPEGKGVIVGLWDTQEDLERAAGFAGQALERFMTFFASPPGREHYRVVSAEFPQRTGG